MEFTTASGVEAKMNAADFLSSMKLKKAILRAAKESNIDLVNLDFSNLKGTALNSILQAILEADSSDDVEDALFKCLGRCTYGGIKITRDIFDNIDPEIAKSARGDYYELVFHCLKENLLPFFQPLVSKLQKLPLTKNQDNHDLKSGLAKES